MNIINNYTFKIYNVYGKNKYPTHLRYNFV